MIALFCIALGSAIAIFSYRLGYKTGVEATPPVTNFYLDIADVPEIAEVESLPESTRAYLAQKANKPRFIEGGE